MSTLSARDKKKLHEESEKALLQLVKLPGNSTCCDCGISGPRWASFNLGCFLCIRCGGIHRRIGTHVTKIKSISLDTWKPDQIAVMEMWGNIKVNSVYLHNAKSRPIPTDDEGMEQYIRDKYERKRFYKPTDQDDFNQSKKNAGSSEKGMSVALKALYEMGFTNIQSNRVALSKTNLNINAAIALMVNDKVSNSNSSSLRSPTNDLSLTQLNDMGFSDSNANKRALSQAKGNLEDAIDLLVKGNVNLDVAVKAQAVLGLNTNKKQEDDDLFGDFEQANSNFLNDIPLVFESKKDTTPVKANVMDEFGDFSFPSPNQVPTSTLPSTTIINNDDKQGEKKQDKDFIMSLFGNASTQNQTQSQNQFGMAQPQFSQPQFSQPQYNQPQFNQPQFNQPQFAQPQFAQPQFTQPQTSVPQFPSSQFAQPQLTPSISTNSPFATPTPTKPDLSGLNSAFASLDPFKSFSSNKTSPTPSPIKPTTSVVNNNQTSQDLLDLL